jgi:hypothetical protein
VASLWPGSLLLARPLFPGTHPCRRVCLTRLLRMKQMPNRWGAAIENVAFNPGMPPLQVALISAIAACNYSLIDQPIPQEDRPAIDVAAVLSSICAAVLVERAAPRVTWEERTRQLLGVLACVSSLSLVVVVVAIGIIILHFLGFLNNIIDYSVVMDHDLTLTHIGMRVSRSMKTQPRRRAKSLARNSTIVRI